MSSEGGNGEGSGEGDRAPVVAIVEDRDEVVATMERPVLLFSGGKDSIVMLRLAEKAFWPAKIPFPVMHVDTGQNFPEAIEFRDERVAELGVRLIVASVQDSIDSGRAVDETGPGASRNRLQIVTMLDALQEHGFDCAIGGGAPATKIGSDRNCMLTSAAPTSTTPATPTRTIFLLAISQTSRTTG